MKLPSLGMIDRSNSGSRVLYPTTLPPVNLRGNTARQTLRQGAQTRGSEETGLGANPGESPQMVLPFGRQPTAAGGADHQLATQ